MRSIPRRAALLAAIIVGLGAQGFAQSPTHNKFEGTINDYVQAGATTWQVSGTWSLQVKGDSGKGDFTASLSMVNPADPNTPAHTHFITLTDGDIVEASNGFTLSGGADITGNNGNLAWADSPIDVAIWGGNTIAYSNVSLTLAAPASGHFGTTPLVGVVKAGK
jgi:hypothetical protein